MYTGSDFDDIDPIEIDDFTVTFVNDINAGETVVSVDEVLLEVMEGTDSNPSSHIFGSPLITSPKVTQRIQTCAPDVYYRLTIVVTTSTGRELSRWSHFWCRTPN